MEILPIDVMAIVGIIFGASIFLIPIAGFTLRFAIKPFVEAYALARGGRRNEAEFALLEKRVALLERQLELAQKALPATTSSAVVGVPVQAPVAVQRSNQ